MDFKLNDIQTVIDVPRIANVHFFEFPKGHHTAMDSHHFCELIFVANGTIFVNSEQFNGTLKKNDFIIHFTDCKHALSCPKNSVTSVIIIGFECYAEKLKYFAKKPILLNDVEIKQLAGIVKEGRNVFAPPYNVPVYDMKKKKKQTYGAEQTLRALLEVFLIGLIRKHEFFEVNEEFEKNEFEINEILNYVNNNFLEKITIDELAFLFHTNRSTLCKEFKAVTGKTIINYINAKKLDFAKEKLAFSSMSISQISYLLKSTDTK